MPRWKDTDTPALPLLDDDPTGRGQGSGHRNKEKQVGAYGGLKISKFDLVICRRYWDGKVPWEVHRDRWFSQAATSHARSLRFLAKLRRRVRHGILMPPAPGATPGCGA